MKKFILTLYLLLMVISSEAQWNFNGIHIYNSNTGNVGIGTSTPGSLLEVGKNMVSPEITVHNFGGAGGAAFAMIDGASGANWKFKATNAGGFKIRDHANSLDVFTIEPNSVANALYINADGHVGIKTASPSYDLSVNSLEYSSTYFYSPFNGGTVSNIIAGGTTSGTWALYAYATTLGYAAYFSGHVYCTGSYLPSDEILKENIQPLQNTLDKVMSLDVKSYYFKQDYPEMNLPTDRQYGFTAQNLETVFPELVKLNPAKEKEQPVEYKAVNYIGLIPVLTEAIQEQQREIEAKDARIDDLQKQIDELRLLVLNLE